MFGSRGFLTTMGALFVAAAVMFTGPGARANVIFVSGDVYGEWSADSVIVVDSVCVPAGETLTILPGVEVLFTGYYRFDVVDGAVLHAVGTESDYITFVPFTQGERTLGLDFMNASNRSILEYCYISNALSSGVHLDNSDITIRNCLIEDSEAPTGVEGGGAIEILNGSDALIENNTLINNYSTAYGGALYIDNSSPVITANDISYNLAGYYGTAGGGGIAVFGNSNPVISFNNVIGNEVHPSASFFVRNGYGGGIYYAGDSGGLIASNVITNNLVDWEPQTETYGGGLYIFGASPEVRNNVIAYNEAESNDGGGIYMYSCQSTLINNVIANNQAGGLGGAIYAEIADLSVVNSVLYFNQDSAGTEIYLGSFASVVVSYSDIEGGWQGTGNIDTDPLFRDPQNGDFHLMSGECGDHRDSPAIDAGDPSIFDENLSCDAGLGTELSDMGAYGGQGLPTGVEDDEEGIIPNVFALSQNYPNPFNARTTISYRLPQESFVTLEIYDTLGRRIETLINNQSRSAGEHQITWDASEQSSGIYFYRLTVEGHSGTSKMLLVK